MPVPVSVTQTLRYCPAAGHAARAGVVDPLVGGLDGDAAAVRHGVAGVDAEVQQRVLIAGRVDQGRPNSCSRRPPGGCRVRPCAGPVPPCHDQAFTWWASDRGLTPREGQQAVRQGRGTLGRALRHGHVAVEVAYPPLRHAGLHQFQRARDAGEQVLKSCVEPPGELPDRLHLLRLPAGHPRSLRGASAASFSR